MTDTLEQRYEELRQLCLKSNNLPDNEPLSCQHAVSKRFVDPIGYKALCVLDDAMLAIEALQQRLKEREEHLKRLTDVHTILVEGLIDSLPEKPVDRAK